MLRWIKKIIDFGTEKQTLASYEKHSIRLINGICLFSATAKIIEDAFTFQLGDIELIIHSLISNLSLILVLYLNYRQKIKSAKVFFTVLLMLILISIPFSVPHSLNADGLFLVFLVIFFAMYTDTKIIIGLTVFVMGLLVFWHVADHYALLNPITKIKKEEVLYIELIYTLMMIVLLTISLLSFKKSALDYQRELTQNIEQKDILIKEVHHRVKNNLQVIASMLSLQETSTASKEALDVIRDVKARVVTMSIIHNKLYTTNDFQYIELKEYITELTELLVSMYNHKNRPLERKIQVESFKTGLEFSIPLGLIITEIISNSIKHAFSPHQVLVIEISGKQEQDLYILKVKDNGDGINELNPHKESLGFLLIDILCKQIQAKPERINNNGLETSITFKL
jgi:two-component sensor histidine kinase